MLFFKNKDTINLGKVTKELRLQGLFHGHRWKWKRTFFRKMSLDLGRMLNPHIVVMGESGSGKSNACKVILRELSAHGMNFLVFDAHDEYLGLAESLGADVYDASCTGVNLFEISGKSDREKASEISGMLRRLLGLGHMQGYALYKAVLYTYQISVAKGREPTMNDLLFTIKVFERHAGRAELGVLRSLEHRLTPLSASAHSRSVKVEGLMNGRSVFALSRLGNSEAQAVYVESFLRKIYESMLGCDKKPRARFFIVIEEAGKLGEGSMLARLVAEGRKYGIGIIVVAQRAKSLDREIRSNAELMIAFYQREPEELNYVANLIASGNELNRFIAVKWAMRKLGMGSAIVSRSRGEPQVVRFDACRCAQRSLSLEIINAARKAVSKDELCAKLLDKGFQKEQTMERVRRLLAAGELRYHVVQCGRYLGVWYISMPRNSAEHDIMVNLIGRFLAEKNVRNAVYNSSYGPDLVAYSKGKRMAVEYETGSKSQDDTRKMLEKRKKTYGRVLLVVNDSLRGSYDGLEGIEVHTASDFFESYTGEGGAAPAALHPRNEPEFP
jgi:Helicase HerA, central domain